VSHWLSPSGLRPGALAVVLFNCQLLRPKYTTLVIPSHCEDNARKYIILLLFYTPNFYLGVRTHYPFIWPYAPAILCQLAYTSDFFIQVLCTLNLPFRPTTRHFIWAYHSPFIWVYTPITFFILMYTPVTFLFMSTYPLSSIWFTHPLLFLI
jgi:hypothetical protein